MSESPKSEQHTNINNSTISGQVGQAGNDLSQVYGNENVVVQGDGNIVTHITQTGDKREVALEKLLQECTVRLTISDKKLAWSNGFFVAPGKILTDAQWLKNESRDELVQVDWQGKAFTARINGRIEDGDINLALLELTSADPNQPCVFLDKVVQPNDNFYSYSYGYPVGSSQGVSVRGEYKGKPEKNSAVIKFRAEHSSVGLTGAPLLNTRTGKVCGIVKVSEGTDLDGISVGTILEKFSNLKDVQSKFHQKDRRWSNLLPLVRCKRRTVLYTSFGMTVLVILIRSLQVFQPFELSFYDSLMRARARLNPPKQDDRILVIKITQDDVDEAKKIRNEVLNDASISNKTLARLLRKLTELKPELQPAAIGLDIYRDDPLDPLDLTKPEDKELKKLLQKPTLFGVCKVGGGDYKEVSPPPEMPPKQVGFSDFQADHAKHVRRHLLAFYNNTSETPNNKCQSTESFNLLLAKHYLKRLKGIETTVEVREDSCQIRFSNGIVLPNLQANTGGYQGYSFEETDRFNGCQLLLNYRSQEEGQAYETTTLEEFLNNDFSVKDRIVLIGVDRTEGRGDNWTTPLDGNDEMTPGVFLQAHMISHILDAAQTKGALIQVLPDGWDRFLILASAFTGGVLGWWALSPRQLGIIILVSCGGGFVISFVAFQMNYWIPLMPHLLALSGASSYVWWSNLQLKLGANAK